MEDYNKYPQLITKSLSLTGFSSCLTAYGSFSKLEEEHHLWTVNCFPKEDKKPEDIKLFVVVFILCLWWYYTDSKNYEIALGGTEKLYRHCQKLRNK